MNNDVGKVMFGCLVFYLIGIFSWMFVKALTWKPFSAKKGEGNEEEKSAQENTLNENKERSEQT